MKTVSWLANMLSLLIPEEKRSEIAPGTFLGGMAKINDESVYAVRTYRSKGGRDYNQLLVTTLNILDEAESTLYLLAKEAGIDQERSREYAKVVRASVQSKEK